MHPISSKYHESPPIADVTDLGAAFEAGVPILVLIDPMLGEPLPAADGGGRIDFEVARAHGWERDIFQIPLHPSISLPPRLHPYLVALHGPTDPLIAITLALAHEERIMRCEQGLDSDGGSPHQIGGWIQSSMHPEDLAEHFSTLFRVRTVARTKATYMRLIDRRVLALLREVAGDARVAGQLGRVKNWSYIGALGHLNTVTSASEVVTPLVLGKTEWEQMELGAAIHRTVKQLLGELDKDGSSPPPHENGLYAQTRTALLAATQAAHRWPHRFKTLQDQTTWAALSILHPGLATMHTVEALMQDSGSPAVPSERITYLHHEVRQLARKSICNSGH